MIFIHGPIAAGKLTVAQALAKLLPYKLFHNHLTVDLALSLFEFGSPPFVQLRETIWLEAFRQSAINDCSLIFTFSPEATVQHGFPTRAAKVVEDLGGAVHFVQLKCSDVELKRRIGNESRRAFKKLSSASEYCQLKAAGAFDFPPLPSLDLCLDTEHHSAEENAKSIFEFVQKLEAKTR